MKSLLVIVTGLSVCWKFTDIRSHSLWQFGVAPFGIFIFLVALCIWVVIFFHNRGITQTTGSDITTNGDSSGGGDC